MDFCELSTFSRVFENLLIQIVFVCFIVSGFLKHYKHALFCFVLLLFYTVAFALHCQIVGLGENGVYRHAVWASFNFSFLVVLAALLNKRLIENYTLIISAFIELISILAHVIRLFDVAVLKGGFTNYFYLEVMIFTNAGFMLLSVLPVLFKILKIRK